MPTKLVSRPSPNFVDSLIGSISGLYLTIISFAVIYCYVGFNQYEQNLTATKLVAIDKLLALRAITVERNLHPFVRVAQLRDLPRFFVDASAESFNELAADVEAEDKQAIDGKKTELPPSKFTREPLLRSSILRDVPMRMAVGGSCDALITQLSPGREFQFATFFIIGGVYNVKSEDVQLASFLRCEPGPSGEFKVFVFHLDDDQYAFAVPRSLDREFFGRSIPDGFKNFLFNELQQTISLLPAPMDNYVHFLDEYVFLHGKAIDYLILSYANTQLGKRIPPDRMNDAVQQLYEQKAQDASYFGISAPGILLVRLGPLVYFVLSFELWRRVRRLPAGKLASDKYWFAFESRDIVGRAYAYLYACAPLLIGMLIYVLFAISQGLGLIVFDRAVTVEGLLALNFPRAPGSGWLTTDHFAIAVAAFIPIQFLILTLTVTKLVSVVAANIRQK
ncbi:hypothetical protein [Bradyrhizobium diazoefficiens]